MTGKVILSFVVLALTTSVNGYAADSDEISEGLDVMTTARFACQEKVLSAIPGRSGDLFGTVVQSSQERLKRRFGSDVATYATHLGYSKRNAVLLEPSVARPPAGIKQEDFEDDIVGKACSKYISSDAGFNNRYPDPYGLNKKASVTQPQAKTSEGRAGRCATAVECVKSMLASAKAEDLASAMDAAKTIDGFPRAARGDRSTARKLNQDGLNALQASKLDEALRLFTQARQADPSDQEIVGNLAYAYAASGQLAKSEDTAVLALSLNPRRTSVWAPLAATLAKERRQDQAVEAMWLAYQFSGDKQKTLSFIDSRLSAETDLDALKMYTVSKAWLVQSIKPSVLGGKE